MLVRPATADDLDGVRSLYGELQPDDPVLDPDTAAAAFDRILTHPGTTVFLGAVDGDAVATVVLSVIPNLTRAARPYAVIENVVVAADRRGTGLGKAVMAHALDAAWEAGCYKAMLMTGSRRPETHAFYRACGFDGDAKHAYLARPPSP